MLIAFLKTSQYSVNHNLNNQWLAKDASLNKCVERKKYTLDTLLLESPLYGNKSTNRSNNTRVLNATITFILSTNKFQEAFL